VVMVVMLARLAMMLVLASAPSAHEPNPL
jgi:hypothetical protein